MADIANAKRKADAENLDLQPYLDKIRAFAEEGSLYVIFPDFVQPHRVELRDQLIKSLTALGFTVKVQIPPVGNLKIYVSWG